jgi:hypothetical protein
MTAFDYRPKDGSDPQGRIRVYFTCHPADFELYFDRICTDILKTHDCVIYYTKDLSREIPQEEAESTLGATSLFVIPVTLKLLCTPNRAMDSDLAYAKRHGIPILPFLMEAGEDVDEHYRRPEKFGTMQYVNPISVDATEISYRDKLKKYLDGVLIKSELCKEVKAAFYAQIFLSYRKKDREYANRLMRLIHDIPECRALSIWYDEFIVFGEDWRENIWTAMKNSALFTVLVTPNLLEDQNFVMWEEYPRAEKSEMEILPVELGGIDLPTREVLSKRFDPNSILTPEDAAFRDRLIATVAAEIAKRSDCDQRHNFLIGLAYLEGIGVELDRARGIALITEAAEAGVVEAIEKMIALYDTRNVADYMRWREKLLRYCREHYDERDERTLAAMEALAETYADLQSDDDAAALIRERAAIECRDLAEDDPNCIAAKVDLLRWNYFRGSSHYAGAGTEGLLLKQIKSQDCKVSPKLLQSLRELVDVMELADALPCAIMWERASLALKRRTLAPNDEEIPASELRLAELLARAESPEAIGAMEEAWLAYRDVCGPRSEKTLTVQVRLGKLYCNAGEYARGRELIEQTCAIASDVWDPDHPLVVDARYQLACVDLYTGNPEAAIDALGEIYEWRKKHLGAAHFKAVTCCIAFCRACYLLGKYAEAIRSLKAVSEITERLAGTSEDESWVDRCVEINTCLVDCHLALSEYAQAYACQRLVCMHVYRKYEDSEEHQAAECRLREIRRLMTES